MSSFRTATTRSSRNGLTSVGVQRLTHKLAGDTMLPLSTKRTLQQSTVVSLQRHWCEPKPAKTHHWPSRAGCPTADVLFELHVVEKLRLIALLWQFACRRAKCAASVASSDTAICLVHGHIWRYELPLPQQTAPRTPQRLHRHCLPLPQQLAKWAPQRLMVERTEVPEHRHKQAGARTMQ